MLHRNAIFRLRHAADPARGAAGLCITCVPPRRMLAARARVPHRSADLIVLPEPEGLFVDSAAPCPYICD